MTSQETMPMMNESISQTSGLAAGSMLKNNTYRIISQLGEGGFGITYLAEHIAMKRNVCIKEFFIRKYCERDGMKRVKVVSPVFEQLTQSLKEKFVKEASVLGTLDHPNIVRVHDSFTENDSAYYVMEYIDGKSLSDFMKERGGLKEEEALVYINAIASALGYIHKRNMLHLDIKPSNIMVRKSDNRAILIDFGLTKHYDESSGELTTPSVSGVSDGYTPIEQYNTSISHFTPETDIYSLGATLYAVISGNQPPRPDALDMSNFPGASVKMSPRVRNTIKRAMQYDSHNRPHSIDEFSKLLNPKEKKNRALGWVAACAIIGVASAVAAVIAVNKFSNKDIDPTPKAVAENVSDSAKTDELINTAMESATECVDNGDYTAAFDYWMQAAELGSIEAKSKIAECYAGGQGVEADLQQAIFWYEQVAETGDTTAMLNIGVCYINESDIQDIDKGIEWFTKAAENGNITAQYQLGGMYLYGSPYTDQNPKRGMEWLEKASNNDHPMADYLIATYYSQIGDMENAVKWYKEGAFKGNADAQHNLGVCHFNGMGGLERNFDAAFNLYQQAADKGHVEATKKLADCYENGWGVEKDRKRAKEIRASLEQ